MDTKSLLGSISPWNISRNATPRPPEDVAKDGQEIEMLKQSSGEDHAVSLRPPLPASRYPVDCPKLKIRWYYAVDSPKKKPFSNDPKALPLAKKFVVFSASDSRAIEAKLQLMTERPPETPAEAGRAIVSVNEDFLYDADVEARELRPAFWQGNIYAIKRGSWFYTDSSATPVDENLANQLEEGYLKTRPWTRSKISTSRSSSQTRPRPQSSILDDVETAKRVTPTDPSPNLKPAEIPTRLAEQPASYAYRLFGAHMNTTVSYQDEYVAWISTGDFMSRLGSNIYGRFGYSGTKVVRGFSDDESTSAPKIAEQPKDLETADAQSVSQDADLSKEKSEGPDHTKGAPIKHKRSALERQISSLAGMASESSKEQLDEESREEQEQEMTELSSAENSGNREIDHLILCCHGIGQRLGLRLDSVSFIHDVNTMRKTIKGVYASSPDLQALNHGKADVEHNSRVQILPVCWRNELNFPQQSVKENRKEADLGEDDLSIDEDDYPSLNDITVEGVPAVRNLITDLALDILLFQSSYRQFIAGIVQRECNRVARLFKTRNPTFNGRISVCGHSLGSAIIFDILCRQKADSGTRRRVLSMDSPSKRDETDTLQLDFPVDNFFCLGSPIALFQMLKGRTIVGRQMIENNFVAESPFDPDPGMPDPFEQASDLKSSRKNLHRLPMTISSPKCRQMYNIFHPTDPIAYRIEPLISPAMTTLKPQALPYVKRGLFNTLNMGARMGQQVGTMWYSFTSGVASSLLNRSLGITGQEQALPHDLGTRDPKLAQEEAKQRERAVSDGLKMPVADEKKQHAIAERALSDDNMDSKPTLIDGELETLLASFMKARRESASGASANKSSNPLDEAGRLEAGEAEAKVKRLKREEAKVRALNSNGRVDYSVQEGTFDISLLASIASHLSYWADEDVNHFMIGQMLRRNRDLPVRGGSRRSRIYTSSMG